MREPRRETFFWEKEQKPFKWNPFTLHGERPGAVRHDPVSIATSIGAFLGSTLFTIPGATTLVVGSMGGTYAVGGAAIAVTVGGALAGSVLLGSLGLSLFGIMNQNTKTPTAMRGGVLIHSHF